MNTTSCPRTAPLLIAAIIVLIVALAFGLLAPILLGHALSSGYFVGITFGGAMVAILAATTHRRS